MWCSAQTDCRGHRVPVGRSQQSGSNPRTPSRHRRIPGTLPVNNTERAHLDRLAQMGCCLCRMLGYGDTPAEIHHLRDGQGMGQRANHYQAIPLCPEHHRGRDGLHGLGTRGFERRYGVTEAQLLERVRAELGA